jgi:hypothetical protein
MLFKLNLHEVKGLFESQLYLKNPNATDLAAARIQATILDGIGCIANGQSVHWSTSGYSTTTTSQITSAESNITNYNDGPLNNNTPNDDNEGTNKKKKLSPAAAMTEASLLLQKATMLEQDIFKAMLDLQREEAALSKGQQMEELKLNVEERHSTAHLLQKMVERLCPEDDPMDRYAARKWKLNEMRGIISEELYAIKIEQLKDKFKKAAEM